MTAKPKPFDSLCVLRSTLNNPLGVSCQKTSGYLTFCKSEYCFDVILGSLILSIAREAVTFLSQNFRSNCIQVQLLSYVCIADQK